MSHPAGEPKPIEESEGLRPPKKFFFDCKDMTPDDITQRIIDALFPELCTDLFDKGDAQRTLPPADE